MVFLNKTSHRIKLIIVRGYLVRLLVDIFFLANVSEMEKFSKVIALTFLRCAYKFRGDSQAIKADLRMDFDNKSLEARKYRFRSYCVMRSNKYPLLRVFPEDDFLGTADDCRSTSLKLSVVTSWLIRWWKVIRLQATDFMASFRICIKGGNVSMKNSFLYSKAERNKFNVDSYLSVRTRSPGWNSCFWLIWGH